MKFARPRSDLLHVNQTCSLNVKVAPRPLNLLATIESCSPSPEFARPRSDLIHVNQTCSLNMKVAPRPLNLLATIESCSPSSEFARPRSDLLHVNQTCSLNVKVARRPLNLLATIESCSPASALAHPPLKVAPPHPYLLHAKQMYFHPSPSMLKISSAMFKSTISRQSQIKNSSSQNGVSWNSCICYSDA